jgi:ABC-type dipeptide/oligopeptide/nickel transport system permease subunit
MMQGLRRLLSKKGAVLCLTIVLLYVAVATACAWFGLAANWDVPVGGKHEAPNTNSILLMLGTDVLGRSVLLKLLMGVYVAVSVGFVTALLAAPIGILVGLVSGYFGDWIDEIVVWFMTTLSSIPGILLLIAISYSLGKGMFAVYVALTATSWISLARVLRGEVMKQKRREYVVAAEAIGAGHMSRMIKHILPNVFHQVILSLSFMVEIAVRSEVLLSYLGLGVQNLPSWGKMIDDSKGELMAGIWWQLASSSVAMFILLVALNILGDYLRDALDPKTRY